jgi:hypothetical protein
MVTVKGCFALKANDPQFLSGGRETIGGKCPGAVNDEAWRVEAQGQKHGVQFGQTTMPGKKSRCGSLPTSECACEVNFSAPGQKPGMGLPMPHFPVTSAWHVDLSSQNVGVC